MLRKFLNYIINAFKYLISIFFIKKHNLIFSFISQNFLPVFNQNSKYGKILFYSPNELTIWRAETLLTKEPETINWIDTFNKNDVFWDIGSNIGVYSLYAAKKGNIVLSFEPSSLNYSIQNKNIELNKLDNNISSYCIAFNNINKLDFLFIDDNDFASALNTFGKPLDWKGEKMDYNLQQGVIGYKIDSFIKEFNPIFPNHLKIDVDGNESLIIEGALLTLKNKNLKSILIELDTLSSEYDLTILKLSECGFNLKEKIHGNHSENSQFSNIFNHIFVR